VACEFACAEIRIRRVFDLLAALDDWTDPAAFDATPEVEELVADLAKHALIEVRG
jgi:hypothetical protein